MSQRGEKLKRHKMASLITIDNPLTLENKFIQINLELKAKAGKRQANQVLNSLCLHSHRWKSVITKWSHVFVMSKMKSNV